MESIDDQLLATLNELGIIDQQKLADLFAQSQTDHTSFQEKLLNADLISDLDLGKTVAELLGVPFVDLSVIQIPQELLKLVPESYAREHEVMAFAETPTEVKLAMVSPTPTSLSRQFIEQKAAKPVTIYYATQRDFEKSLKAYKQNLQSSFDELLQEQVAKIGQNGISEVPIISMVDIFIAYAYANGASDIHIEPEKDEAVVRFRIDGVMEEVLHYALPIHAQVIARLKFLAKLRTDEHLSAQDGKIQTKIENEELDIRVSILPTIHGEKSVMRLLSARYRQFGLADLGMSGPDLQKVEIASKKPYGMILSTGPTGSGKTTTMYAIIKLLNSKERNIATIEDPVEYEVAGLNQIQVNPKTNLTFAEGLRSILRQDPNVIYVGEIRDDDTANIATNSAMTGHLVLSTLHTNDAATSIPRLMDMKIEPFLVASTVNVIIGQRLVRKICDRCRVSQVTEIGDLEQHFPKEMLEKYFPAGTEVRTYHGKGCPVCRMTGYLGRIGIFEVLEVTEKLKELITKKETAQVILDVARSEGMTTMTEDGILKVHDGLTTIEEVVRATKE